MALTWNSSSTATSNSPIPNRPITATTKLTPFTSSSMPMVSRTLPETVSMPTPASPKPMASDTSVLTGGEPPMPTKLAKARKYTAKYSAGPNASATLATQEADTVMSTTPQSAPKAAEPKAVASAVVGLPSRAIGYPSKVVATEEGSPGMLNRIEVTEPPNSAPQYIEESRIIADTGCMPKVSGNSSDTPLGAPRPGNTPTRMPSRTPINIRKI